MIYFWIIPVLLLLTLLLFMFFRDGTKRTTTGRSRLDEALALEGEDRGPASFID